MTLICKGQNKLMSESLLMDDQCSYEGFSVAERECDPDEREGRREGSSTGVRRNQSDSGRQGDATTTMTSH